MKTSLHDKGTDGPARMLATIAALLLSVSSQAGDTDPAYTMTVISDQSFGHAITAGRYAEAIDRITAEGDVADASFEAKTNLCVAYTKSGDLENAATACEAAVASIRKRSARAQRFAPAYEAGAYRAYEALALSNRGVLHAVRGKAADARKDFLEASRLRARIEATKANLARLEVDRRM